MGGRNDGRGGGGKLSIVLGAQLYHKTGETEAGESLQVLSQTLGYRERPQNLRSKRERKKGGEEGGEEGRTEGGVSRERAVWSKENVHTHSFCKDKRYNVNQQAISTKAVHPGVKCPNSQ